MIRERGELLLQLVEQLHDSDVRAVALPHRGPPSSWQGLPAGAGIHHRYMSSGSSLPGPIPVVIDVRLSPVDLHTSNGRQDGSAVPSLATRP